MTRGRPASAATVPVPRFPRRFAPITILVIGLLVVVAHLPLRHADYIQDDHLAVEENPIVERGSLGEIFSTSYWAGARGDDRSLYRPVAILSYALERKATGRPDPFVAHVVNVLLHLAASLSLFGLARRLGAEPLTAAAGAMIFSVHPIHVEAIANIVGRAEILAALLSFVGLGLLTRSGAWEREGRPVLPSTGACRLAAWGAAAALFLALGSKEVALATPLLYVALELLFRPGRRHGGRDWWIDRAGALAPSALAVLLYLWLRVRALEMLVSLQQAHPADNPLVRLDGLERAATALGLLARYARLLLYPLRLSADYSGPSIAVESSLAAVRPIVGTLLLIGCVVLISLPLWRSGNGGRSRLAAFFALLFLLPYLIVGNLVFTVGTIFAERLIYLPSAGFCLLLGLLLEKVARGRLPAVGKGGSRGAASAPFRLAALALSALATGFVVLSWSRSLDWRNDETVFRAAVRAQPRSPRAHFLVGKLHADRGEAEAALACFERTTDLYPEYVAAWLEKGVALGRRGDLVRAEAMFREALRISPQYADAHLNLGIALRRQGRAEEAERSLRKAVLWDPESATAWTELGNLRLKQGRYRSAARDYRRAMTLGRRDLGERLRKAERLGASPSSREPVE